MSQKKKKTLLIVGILSCILAGICFLLYYKLEDYGLGMKGRYSVSAITGADISADDVATVMVDNFDTALLLDNETKKIRWIKAAKEFCGGYAQLGKVVLDEQNNAFVHVIQYDESYNQIVEEFISQVDPSGKEVARISIPDLSEEAAESEINSLQYTQGSLFYYNKHISQIVRMDASSGQTEIYGNYDSQAMDDSFSVGLTQGDVVTLPNTDGSLALGYPDGTVEEIGRINYQLDEEGPETIVNQYLYVDGKHFITDGRYFDSIYEYADGNLEKVIDVSSLLDLGVALEVEYYNYVLNSGISAMDNGNGKILITLADNLFYTEDMEQFYVMDGPDDFTLPASASAKGWVKTIAFCLMYVFGLIGFALVCGSIFKWRLSLRSKLFIIVLPLSLFGILFVSYQEIRTVEKDFKEQQYEEYDAISAFYRNQIDKETLQSIASLDDADKLDVLRQNMMANLEGEVNWPEHVNINVYRYFDNSVHLLLYSTTTDCLFVSSFLLDFEEKQADRLPKSDTYHFETKGIASTYIDSITYLRDDSGQIYGFVDVYGDMDKLQMSENQMKQKVLIITVILGLIMAALLYILAYYIIRHLRMTSKVVGSIAKGNFGARVEKITKDELGVISSGVNDMAGQIETLFDDQEEFTTQVIETLVGTIDAKDKYTNGHSIRVAKYSRMIAEKLGKSHEECKEIYYVGLLHDIGKIGVPDEIINKTARLTDEEFAIIKTHPEIGNRMLSNLTKINNISIGAHYHHERFDGRGYPEGLKGEEIPEIARIIAVADTYDAMTSNRSYRKAMAQEKVRGELEKGKGTQFDPVFADIMLIVDMEIKDEIYAKELQI